MNNRILPKLRSRSGASITAALLVFLACAVLSSVVIAAATAASGRMSKIAQTDQRYYAVTSAAGLLKGLIHGKTVSVVEVTDTTYTTSYTAGVAGEPVRGDSVTRTYIVPKRADEVSAARDYISQNAVGNPAYVVDTIPEDAAKSFHEGRTLNDRRLALATTFYADAGLDYDVLAVSILENMDADGNLTLTLYNRNKAKDIESDSGSRYTLEMAFGADRSVSTSTKTETVSSQAVSSSVFSVVTKATETTITSLTWRLDGIRIYG